MALAGTTVTCIHCAMYIDHQSNKFDCMINNWRIMKFDLALCLPYKLTTQRVKVLPGRIYSDVHLRILRGHSPYLVLAGEDWSDTWCSEMECLSTCLLTFLGHTSVFKCCSGQSYSIQWLSLLPCKTQYQLGAPQLQPLFVLQWDKCS